MGESEQVIAEPDELEENEGVEGVHPPSLQQQNPRLVKTLANAMTSFVVASGWHVLVILLLGFIAWTQFGPKIKRWLKKREENQEALKYHKNPDVQLANHQAIEESRRKLQEKYNVSLEKKKKDEEQKKDKVAECKQSVKVQNKSSASVSAQSSTYAKGKPATKRRMRPEYNPLTGDTGSSSSSRWRPSRGASGGG